MGPLQKSMTVLIKLEITESLVAHLTIMDVFGESLLLL